MNPPPEPATVADALRAALTGGSPRAELFAELGGWGALEVLAPAAVDDPILTPAVALLVREVNRAAGAGQDLLAAQAAALALARAVLECSDPLQFTAGLDALCADPAVADLVGRELASDCIAIATPPRDAGAGTDPDERDVLRSAVALESAARLAASGHLSRHKVLAALSDVSSPQPVRYARAVTRTVSLAFDLWAPGDDVADVIDILTGAKSTGGALAVSPSARALDERYRQDIAPDAMWTMANVELAKALRVQDAQSVEGHLATALTVLDALCEQDDRPDAGLLRAALRILHALVASLGGDSPRDVATWALSRAEIDELGRRDDAFAVEVHGLSHWSGDRKATVVRGWRRLLDDLATLQDVLQRDSLYDAATILDDVLAIYGASRTYDVTRVAHGVEHLLRELRPAVEGSFAVRAGLLRNLSDHTEALGRRLEDPNLDDDALCSLQRRLSTAQEVLALARARMLTAPEPPGKPREQSTPLPPLLRDLLTPFPHVSSALSAVAPAELETLAGDLADRQVGTHPGLIETKVRQDVLRRLAVCEDFTGDVVPAVTMVLDQLIAFVSRRMNTQRASKAYLFDPAADESALHDDLYDWLSQGRLSAQANVEVQEVGGGRVDIQVTFTGFHLYLELKADDTAVPVEGKAAYIKQTVAYQATDVRISFLVVLRLAAPKDRSPAPHLSDNVTHTTMPVAGSASERHVVMVEVPGNQTRPSEMR